MKVLVTGAAGFVGSHVCDVLLARGHEVRGLDDLDPQVHPDHHVPAYLDPGVKIHVGDIRDRIVCRSALRNADAVIHLAARVGTAQGDDEPASYCDVNVTGTAILLEEMRAFDVKRLVVASSMSVYGEGWQQDASIRSGHNGEGRPTGIVTEYKSPEPRSVYGLTKLAQEKLCLIASPVPCLALRYFNIYGPRQALTNPYTGVGAIFTARILRSQPPIVFEDGRQTRDFVHVSDIARATVDALESDHVGVLNIGTGEATEVRELARMLCRHYETTLEPDITGRVRPQDVRHCVADISKARKVLGYEPQVALKDGLADLAAWAAA